MNNPAPVPRQAAGAPIDAVVAWLLLCCAMVFAIAVIGAITRLTESGLSITEWRPVAGALPPLSEAAWVEEFAKYKESSQYRLLNQGMTLDEFKQIFWWEYIHRLWGRLIGVVYLVPFLWFLARGRIDRRLGWQLGGIFVLGGLQGALGWYMVASGLVDRYNVSPYRLAAHLGLAVVIYGLTLWVALNLIARRRPTAATPHPGLAAGALALAILIFVTILSGAFVAGNDAGMIYNTFPLMDGHWIPDGYFHGDSGWTNLFENVAAVQFNHRALAILTLCLILWYRVRALRAGVSGRGRLTVHLLAATAVAQVSLGIATLIYVVPIPLAALHQAGALILFAIAVAAAHEFRRAPAVNPVPAAAQ